MSSPYERLTQAGADIVQLAETSVRVRVGELPVDAPLRHPVWALCRALRAIGLGSVVVSAPPYVQDAFRTEAWGAGLAYARACDERTEDIVVDLANEALSPTDWSAGTLAKSSRQFALRWGPTWIAMTTACAEATTVDEDGLDQSFGRLPQAALARLGAGLILQEVAVLAGQLAAAEPPLPRIQYDASTRPPQACPSLADWPDLRLDNCTADIVGVGALGTVVAEVMAELMGEHSTLRLFDDDVVGLENLAVQPSFAESAIGSSKVEAMAEILAPMVGARVEVQAYPVRYKHRPADLDPADVRLVCVDSFASRLYLSDCSLGDGVPLVEAGISPVAGAVHVYEPGRTTCLEHQVPNLRKKAALERDSASCSALTEPTLPGVAAVCGSLMALEAARVLVPGVFGECTGETILYDCRSPERLSTLAARPPCSHGPLDLPSSAARAARLDRSNR